MQRRVPPHLAFVVSPLILVGCGRPPVATYSVSSGFIDITKQAGLQFVYDNDASPSHRFIESTGGGCGFFDFDGDGRMDIIAVQGGPAPGGRKGPRPSCKLYRNVDGLKFVDVTHQARLDLDFGNCQGVSAADYDNDGRTDLLFLTYGGARLLHNRGGRFEEVTGEAGLIQKGEPHWAVSAAWGDYDRDGRLDLFVCHYASWFPDAEQPCRDSAGRYIYCTPTQYPGDTSVLYHNEGNGKFKDVSQVVGISRLSGKAMSAVWIDANEDGWPDLFVANDMTPNWLLINEGGKRFEDVGLSAGVALGSNGQALSGMGVACADFSGRGLQDIFVANFSQQPRSLFVNEGQLAFQNRGVAVFGEGPKQPYLAFGVENLDFDRDGNVDLVIGNGHINEVLDSEPEQGVTYRQPQQLMHNKGGGDFSEDKASAGDLLTPRITRGLAVGDIDNDGRADVLVSGPQSPLSLFRNGVHNRNHWVGIKLNTGHCNRGGIGSKVEVGYRGKKCTKWVRAGSSYASISDLRLIFGLQETSRCDYIRVTWPCGAVRRYTVSTVDRYLVLNEEAGTRETVPTRSIPDSALKGK